MNELAIQLFSTYLAARISSIPNMLLAYEEEDYPSEEIGNLVKETGGALGRMKSAGTDSLKDDGLIGTADMHALDDLYRFQDQLDAIGCFGRLQAPLALQCLVGRHCVHF